MRWPWSRGTPDPDVVPAWAADVMDGGMFARFCGLVEGEARWRDPDARFDFAEGVAQVRGMTAGLFNLMQTCAPLPLGGWQGVVRTHFARMLDPDDALPPLATDPLRLRLMEDADHAVGYRRPFAEGVVEFLMVDAPTRVSSLTAEGLRSYGLTAEEAWERAETFHQRDDEFERTDLGSPDGRIVALEGNSFYVASQARHLARFDAIGRCGSLVAIPNRHFLLAAPLETSGAIGNVARLASVASDAYARGPGSISPRVFWVDDGSWHPVEVRIGAGGAEVWPPPEMIARLEG